MKQGDIYLVSLDPGEGHEQRGNRPVLLVSSTAFNKATKTAVVCPITQGGDFARRIGFSVPISGIATTGIVRCDQPRTVDLAARGARKIDTLPDEIMAEVLAKVTVIFE